MAKHRSKKERLLAQKRRLKNLQLPKESTKIQVSAEEKPDTLFSYDPKLIIKDLKKTFLLIICILLVLLSIALIYT